MNIQAPVIHDLDTLTSEELIARWQFCQEQLDRLKSEE